MELVFASNNENKIAEIRRMLPASIRLLSLTDIGCTEDIAETADTIEGNAILKADYVTRNFGYDCFADDTGLEVDALGGAPGVISARYAGDAKDNAANIAKLLTQLGPYANRSAQFKTVIALNIKGQQHLFTGIVRGQIAASPVGTGGFGYDPVFIAEGFSDTFASISADEKASVSHRGIAVRHLIRFLKN